jgi:acyl transferase domain-containing protein
MKAEVRRLVFFYGSREVLRGGLSASLMADNSRMREMLIRCDQYVSKRLGWSIRPAFAMQLFDNEAVRPPCLTALQIALTEGWKEKGIEPDVIAGRSGGEYAAEYARGTLVLEDAMEVACRISSFIRDRRGVGRMCAVRLDLSATQRLAQSSPVEFFVVADTADDITIIACQYDDAEDLHRFLAARQIEHRLLDSGMAPHSPLIDEWKPDLVKPLTERGRSSELLPYYSASATGRDNPDCYYTRLWRAVREPAFVGRLLDNLIADGCNIFLEIGGQPMLGARIQRRATAAGKQVVTLPRQHSEFIGQLMQETKEILRQTGVPIRSDPPPEHVGSA